MGRIAIFDDFQALGNLAVGPLAAAGHEVRVWCSPIDFEEVVAFRPQLIKIELYRNRAARNRPIRNLEEDVLGFKPLSDLERYPAAQVIPIMLVGVDIEEADIPTSINYDLFLTFPDDAELMLPKILELINTVKTRRMISRYYCPHCKSRLTYTQEPERDLFCPRCHVAVAIINDEECACLEPGSDRSRPCSLADLAPPSLPKP